MLHTPAPPRRRGRDRRGPGPRFLAPCLFLVLAALSASLPAPAARAATRAEFDAFVDTFVDGWYAFRPVEATRAGLHQHDTRFAGFTRDEILAETARLKGALAELRKMTVTGLDSSRVADRDILLARIQGTLLELEQTRPWEKDPNYYADMVTGGVYNLVARSFAPAPDRLRSVIAREKAAGAVLAAAFENLVNPPRIWTEIALEQTRGGIEFFRTTVPAAFADVTDPALRAEFEAANSALIRDLESFAGYLETGLLPTSNGDFRMGEVNFQAMLQYDEMCDIPVFRLEKIGEEHLKTLQTEVKSVAAEIDPEKTPQELFRILSVDHPKPADLVRDTNALLEDLRRFCLDKGLVTIPGEERCRAVVTPEFMRSWIFAAMDTPGPFEKTGREAYYFVTPPDPKLPALAQDDHMRFYNRYALPIVSMHEAWPGHFLQHLRNEQATSKVRKVFGSTSFSEGWGLYVEQMMLDEGWGDADPRYRLFQLRLALLRACRYLVAIRMHTGQMTVDQAVEFFIQQGMAERIDAEREAKRGTIDPGYLSYQLGKLQILKCREDYKRYMGDKYQLRDFHDRVLSQGEPPVKLLRRLLMPGDKGTLL